MLILADKTGHPDWIAADLLAQAEHDESAQSILITDDAELAQAVETALAAQLALLPRAAVAGASWRDFGAIILVGELPTPFLSSTRSRPEHLEIESVDAEALAGRIRNAGAIFLGAHTPEAIGDYVSSNHVLPTARSARFVGAGRARLHEAHVHPQMRTGSIARARARRDRARRGRGLDAHARSVAMRLNR